MRNASSLQSIIKRRIKEGRGQGEGMNYKPWYTAKEVPSHGRTFRPKGMKNAREHLLLSEWEYFYFLLLDWSDQIIDIREQYPLLDIDETIDIAAGLQVDHPIDPQKNELKVMTMDFLLTFIDGSECAVSFKKCRSITAREVEKMEIERIYWEKRGIAWELVTEKDISVAYAKNIDFVHKTFYFEDYQISNDIVMKAKRIMEPLVLKKQSKLTDITNFADDRLGLQPGDSLTIARHLIATKRWIIDMDQLIDTNAPLEIKRFVIEDSMKGEMRRAN